jgi:hypothetical protein
MHPMSLPMSLRGAKRRSNLARMDARTLRRLPRTKLLRRFAPNKKQLVMAALDPAIYAPPILPRRDDARSTWEDGRVKPGHDEEGWRRDVSFRAGRPPGRWSTRNDMRRENMPRDDTPRYAMLPDGTPRPGPRFSWYQA